MGTVFSWVFYSYLRCWEARENLLSKCLTNLQSRLDEDRLCCGERLIFFGCLGNVIHYPNLEAFPRYTIVHVRMKRMVLQLIGNRSRTLLQYVECPDAQCVIRNGLVNVPHGHNLQN